MAGGKTFGYWLDATPMGAKGEMAAAWSPQFGTIDAFCDLNFLPPGATEWKARAEVSGGDLTLRGPKHDNCEELPL